MSKLEETFKQYEHLGKLWLNGKDFDEIPLILPNGEPLKLNPKQLEFINDKTRFSLVSGGMGSGKTTAFVVKLWLLCVMFPNNRILLGRRTRQDVERATLPDILDLFPPGTYTHKVGPGEIHFPNGSRIIFYGLDALQSGAGQDIKKAEQKIKSLNLGAIFIDQLEEVEQRIVEALDARLRRQVPIRQMCFTTNPANFWAYDFFKAHPRPNTKLIETSMLDNKDNLPADYIESNLNKSDGFVKRYVHGIWDIDSLVDGTVFGESVVRNQDLLKQKPIRQEDGVMIFHEPDKHDYQIGVDPSIGSEDPCFITVVDKETGEVVASYSAYVPTNVITEKVVQLAMQYSLKKKPLVVPEVTGIGQALIEDLKKVYPKIYERETFLQREKRYTKKLGFYTNYATKTQLIEHMKELFQKKFPKVRDPRIVEELKTFIYSDEAHQKGAGAQHGFHDDGVMSMMLAFWNVEAQSLREKSILDRVKKTAPKQIDKYHYA